MPRVVQTTVYAIDELSDAARVHARAWYREHGLHDEWYDFVYEEFGTICRILGVTLATTTVRLNGGGTPETPQIFWSGFSSQGDGASFAGAYSYARGAARAIRAHAPHDPELHRIVDALQAVQRRNFHQLHAQSRVGPERPVGLTADGFLQPALRTGRAPFVMHPALQRFSQSRETSSS